MKLTKVRDRIYHVTTKKGVDLARIFMRFQEHYESPKYKDKIFTVKEFKEWYRIDHGGRFTYNTDWAGFNFPSTILTPFINGDFNPLTLEEKALLKILSPAIKSGKPFYVIGTSEEKSRAINHELSHALFFTNPKYAKVATSLITKENTKGLEKWLTSIGYNKSVHIDEICAYTTHDAEYLKEENLLNEPLHLKLKILFKKYWKGSV